ncbi:MAG: TIGR03032 family protein [Acidimicrobiia bacterium]|jgi:uncharacterized protein (TIGR03032 family)
MRLPVAFLRLPFTVDADALARELDALPTSAWKDHPEGAVGNTAVPLVAINGDPGDDAVFGPMLPTPSLAALPYTRRVMGALDSVIGRSRLMRIPEEGDLYAHVDVAYYWRDHLRVHVPVVSDPSVEFHCGGESVHMAPGEVWVFDTWRRHKVVNPANHPRTHLVIDTVGSAALWDLIRNAEQAPRAITVDAPEPTIITELVNKPAVVSPWELNWAYQMLLQDLAQRAPDAVAPLAAAFEPVLRAWRNAWARFGDDPTGYTTFSVIRREAEDRIARAGGEIPLPNGIRFLDAARNHALIAPERPAAPRAATPATAADPAAAPRPAPTPASQGAAPRIERPLFIVSSPRSGSSLMFETLARSPDLYSVGGESHQIIESIPAFRPAAHDWHSNRLDATDATPDLARALRNGFLVQLRDRDGRKPVGPVRMLEKTPKNSLRVPFLREVFPDAIFVYLYRDPRETVSSMLDAWRSGRFKMYDDLPGWTGTPWSLLLVPGWRDLIGKPLGEVVSTQWATATTWLLDDLEALDPDRWCVASYDRLVADPQVEMERLAMFAGVRWDVALDQDLPLSRHTLDSPHPDKWMRNADELEPYWEKVAEVAERAHGVFASPPRTQPVVPLRSPDAPVTVRTPSSDADAPPAPAKLPAPTANTPGPLTDAQGNEIPPDAPAEVVFGSSHTASFPKALEVLGGSILVTTYQTGHLIAFRVADGTLNTHFRRFPSPMGMALHDNHLALGTKAQVLVFQNQPAMIPRLDPPDRHDACFMPRHSHNTGDIRIHDLGYAGDELWIVNTRFSCLATLDDKHSFVPRWRPPFITALAPEDRCHLNGMCVIDDEPRYVTALGTSDEAGGWREEKLDGGVLMDVRTGEVVSGDMCMPHSPRWYDGRLWLLESGRGILATVDLETGERTEVGAVPGFARGLSFLGPYAFIGLSQVREHVFEGLPLTGDGVERNCGVWVLDTRNGEIVAWVKFSGTVHEIYDVMALPRQRYPEIVEPGAELADSAFVLPDEALVEVPAELRS